MALNVVAIKDNFGVLKYFNQYAEEKEGSGRDEQVVGIRYKLVSYSGLAKEIIINTNHKTPLIVEQGSTVKLVNPSVVVAYQRIGEHTVPMAKIYADDLQVVKG